MEQKKEKFSYKVRTLRISDEAWEKLKDRRYESRKSWNLFIMDLVEKK